MQTKKITVLPAASSRLGSRKNLAALKESKVKAKVKAKGNHEMTLRGNQQVGKTQKKEVKKMKKQRKRAGEG